MVTASGPISGRKIRHFCDLRLSSEVLSEQVFHVLLVLTVSQWFLTS